MSANLSVGVVGSAFAAVNPPMSERAGQPLEDPAGPPQPPPAGSTLAKINPPVNPEKALGISEQSSGGMAVVQ
ncbi:MAG TPA: hypothetical protein VGM98_07895 [Schlesneria sp.]|jgi:hypothetical protein